MIGGVWSEVAEAKHNGIGFSSADAMIFLLVRGHARTHI